MVQVTCMCRTWPVASSRRSLSIARPPPASRLWPADLCIRTGWAVDGAGNVFFDDFSNSNNSGSSSSDNLVEEIPFGCTSASCFRTLGSGFNLLVGVAVDLSGDVFVSDFGNNAVKELVAVNGVVPASPTINVLAGGFSGQTGPDGLTLDASGNVYVTNHDNGHALYEIPIAGGYSTLNTVSNGFTAPEDVAFDGTGNAFVVDEDTNSLYELPATGGSLPASPSVNVLANNFNSPEGVVVDALGNVYVADYGNSRVVKIDYSDAPSVSFATTTTVGSTDTTDGPQKVTIQNNGNATMSFTGIAASTNFKIDSGTTTCSTTVGLAAGSSCVVGVNFAPTAAGALSGTLTLTDDALNAAGATQAIALSGTGVAAAAPMTPVLTWAMPAAITTATPLSATQLDATAADANGTTVPGTFVYTPAAGAMLAAGTQTLSVTFTPTNTAAFTTATKTVSIVVTQATTAPAATTTTLAVTSGNEAATTVAAGSVVTLTASVSANQNSIAPGQVAFCDATATTCTGSYLLATVELVAGDTSSMATYRFVPGIGAHSYKAVFLGTTAAAGSASTAAALAVTGTVATTSVLTSAGTQGSYALTATVAGFGPGSPTGNVVFTDTSKNAVLGTMPVSAAVRNFVTGGTMPGAPVAVGSAPTQVVSADVNGDGKLDLVVANGSGTMVTVLIGNGNGTYTAMPSFGTNYSGITGISVGDFNGDGNLDIATANGSSVGIFLGSGDGTFGAEQDFTNTGASQGVFAADLNGDGKLDLVVTDNNSGITIMIGNGDGTFTQLNGVYATGGGPNFSLAVADFNGDGKLDVAFGNKYDNTLSVLLGNGDGTFQTQKVTAAGSAPRAAASGDFNGDGKQDLVQSRTRWMGRSVSCSVTAMELSRRKRPMRSVPMLLGGAVGDLNGDGKLDIAVANQNDGTVSVLYGNGDGTFQTQQVLAAGGGADYVAIGDVNGDGSPDLAVANAGDSTVSVFLNEAQSAVTLPGVTLPGTGMDNVVATYAGDTVFTGSTSNTLTLASNVVGTTVITWTPTVATIAYGTALGAQQLDATAATAAGVAIPGTFVYTPAAGTVLTAGMHVLSVAFTPTSAAFAAATGTATITVTKVTPVITWAAPAGIAYGTALSAAQLDATVAGVGTGALAGTLVYTPIAGTVLTPGMHTLSVAFTPTDAVDYTGATASVNIVVGGLGLSGIAPLGAVLGGANTTITLTGTGFVPTSVVMAGTDRLATTYVNGTTLTAVVPVTLLGATGTFAVTVSDPTIEAVSAAQTFTVLPVVPGATLTGPSTTAPGTQPTVGLTITNPYPLALTAQFTLTFASAGATPVDDPSIQFSSGGRMYSYTVAANSTSVPPVQLQAGTDAGTITIRATLMADGVDVTPTGLAPLVIVVPPVVPMSSRGRRSLAAGNDADGGDPWLLEYTGGVVRRSSTSRRRQAMCWLLPALTLPATTIFSNVVHRSDFGRVWVDVYVYADLQYKRGCFNGGDGEGDADELGWGLGGEYKYGAVGRGGVRGSLTAKAGLGASFARPACGLEGSGRV